MLNKEKYKSMKLNLKICERYDLV